MFDDVRGQTGTKNFPGPKVFDDVKGQTCMKMHPLIRRKGSLNGALALLLKSFPLIMDNVIIRIPILDFS
mgnify:CR=1 FL=1